MKKSWKTTGGGLAAILIAVGNAVQLLADGDPATNPDFVALGTAVTTGLALIFARDNNVTSEEAGAKPKV